jgi:hypothetical protein
MFILVVPLNPIGICLKGTVEKALAGNPVVDCKVMNDRDSF